TSSACCPAVRKTLFDTGCWPCRPLLSTARLPSINKRLPSSELKVKGYVPSAATMILPVIWAPKSWRPKGCQLYRVFVPNWISEDVNDPTRLEYGVPSPVTLLGLMPLKMSTLNTLGGGGVPAGTGPICTPTGSVRSRPLPSPQHSK